MLSSNTVLYDTDVSLAIYSLRSSYCGSSYAVRHNAETNIRSKLLPSSLYGRFLYGAHAYGQKDTVDSFMRYIYAGDITDAVFFTGVDAVEECGYTMRYRYGKPCGQIRWP